MSAREHELEYESEEFFRALPTAALRSVGTQAARAALQAGMRTLGHAESEWEAESETEAGRESAVNPIRRVYPDAMMEHFAHAAAEAESEAEAEAFIGALVPIA